MIPKSNHVLRVAFFIPCMIFAAAIWSQTENSSFRFAFLTDIHLQPERQASEGFSKAIAKVNELNPDFVITGGDLIMDALKTSYGRADSLYNMFISQCSVFSMPVFHSCGNHEVLGWHKRSKISPEHPDFGKSMFKNRLADPYRSMNYQNWHFIFLDATHFNDSMAYHGEIDTKQLEWLKSDLKTVDNVTPIAVITHIPLLSAGVQYFTGNNKPVHPSELITNNIEVLDVFKKHNLKLVLQGHLHYYEKTEIDGVHFVTGGAVSGAWWTGSNQGTEEGFVMVKILGDAVDIQYVDFGWNPVGK